MAVLGLRFCARAFSSCGKRRPLFIAVRGCLTITASLVVEHRLQTHRLSNCGSRAQLLCGIWDLPRPGLEPMSPALAGRFSTTAPPGKPWNKIFFTISGIEMTWDISPLLYKFIFPHILESRQYVITSVNWKRNKVLSDLLADESFKTESCPSFKD